MPATSSASTPVETPAAAAGTINLGDDLVVNRLGYGAMRLTGPGIMGQPADRDEAKRVLRRALDLGVDFIDTADSYGPYVSEELIAESLYPYPPGLVIATKGGFERPGPNQWTPNGRPEHLRRALDGSLRRLKLERIDLWQLHRIDPKVPADEQFETLAAFIRDGKVRHVGLSEVSVADVERARRVIPIVSVQNRYNISDRQWEDVLNYCERNGLVFIPWFPLAAGALTKADQAAHDALERIAQRRHAMAMQVALAWLLARSPAILAIPGTSKVRHLEENVSAAALRLTDQDLQELAVSQTSEG
jgi:pyridoxine 4-dehydrogenase